MATPDKVKVQKRLKTVLKALDTEKSEQFCKKYFSLYIQPGEDDKQKIKSGYQRFLRETVFLEKDDDDASVDDDDRNKYDEAFSHPPRVSLKLAERFSKIWPDEFMDAFKMELKSLENNIFQMTPIVSAALKYWKNKFLFQFMFNVIEHNLSGPLGRNVETFKFSIMRQFVSDFGKLMLEAAPDVHEKLTNFVQVHLNIHDGDDLKSETVTEVFKELVIQKGIQDLVKDKRLVWIDKMQRSDDSLSSFFDSDEESVAEDALPCPEDELESGFKQNQTEAVDDKVQETEVVQYIGHLKSTNDPECKYPLDAQDPLVIGRSQKYANVLVDDPKASRNHAEVKMEDGTPKIFLLDGSCITVHGKKITEKGIGITLEDGVEIKLGRDTCFTFQYLPITTNGSLTKTPIQDKNVENTSPKATKLASPVQFSAVPGPEVFKPKALTTLDPKKSHFENLTNLEFAVDPKHAVRKEKFKKEEHDKRMEGYNVQRKPKSAGKKFHEKKNRADDRSPFHPPKGRDLYREQDKHLSPKDLAPTPKRNVQQKSQDEAFAGGDFNRLKDIPQFKNSATSFPVKPKIAKSDETTDSPKSYASITQKAIDLGYVDPENIEEPDVVVEEVTMY